MQRGLFKLAAELRELQRTVCDCLMNGMDEHDGHTEMSNRDRLMNRLGDTQARIGRAVLACDLDQHYMARRTAARLRWIAEQEAISK